MNKYIKKHNKMLMETGETKLHNKLVKSKKGWLKVALGTTFASAALFTFSAVNAVNADTITTQLQSNSQPEQQSTTEVAQTNNVQSNQANIQSQATQQSTQGQNLVTQPQSAQRATMTKMASTQYAGNQAVIQYGVLNQDVKGQSGTVYKAGTQVSRGVLGLGNQPSGDYYLSMAMGKLVGEAHMGPSISPAYVTPTNTQSYPTIGDEGQWGSQSYFNQSDSGGAVVPVNGQGVQADKSKLQADINQAKQLLAGKVKLKATATTTGVDPVQWLQTKLTKAEAVNNDSTATQATVDSAEQDLGFVLSEVEVDTPNNPSDNGGSSDNGNSGKDTPNNSGQTPGDNNGSGDKGNGGVTTPTNNGDNSNNSGTSDNGNSEKDTPANGDSATNSGNQGNNGTNTPATDNGSNTNNKNSNSNQSAKNNDSSSQTEGKHFAPTTNADGSINNNDYKGRYAAPTVVVENGQTLSQIAADHGVSVDSLLQNNPEIKDANHVVNGQIVNLPASQHKDNATSNSEKRNTLPQTGQSQNETLTFSGILAVIASLVLGLGEFFKIRKED